MNSTVTSPPPTSPTRPRAGYPRVHSGPFPQNPRWRGRAILLLAFVALFGLLAPSALAESYQLSTDGPLPIGGDVVRFEISPDGMWVVYQAAQEVAEIYPLYVVPTDGSEPPRKLITLASSQNLLYHFAITPDNQYVVYSARQDSRDINELYSVPLDGSTPPRKLSGTMEAGSNIDLYFGFILSPDGQRAIYRADVETDELNELYSVPVDGSMPPVRLNGPLHANGIQNYLVSPDSDYVIYTADQEDPNVFDLYRVPIDGSEPPLRLSPPGSTARYIIDIHISPDASWVTYLADQNTPNFPELYSVPSDGSAPSIRLNRPLPMNGYVSSSSGTAISPDSKRVVYVADQDVAGVRELYSVAIDGSSMPVKLNPNLVTDGDVSASFRPRISPDGSRVIYVADQETNDVQELFSVPLMGGTATKLNGTLLASGIFSAEISADSARVVYLARQDSPLVHELYSVPLAGGSPTKLNGPLIMGGSIVGFRFSEDGASLLYSAVQDLTDQRDLYLTPTDGSAPAIKVNAPLTAGGDVMWPPAFAPGGAQVLYRADLEQDEVIELYSTSLLTPGVAQRLNGPLAIGADIWDFEPAPLNDYVVYQADHDVLNRDDLYSVRLDGSADPINLTRPIPRDRVEGFILTPDGLRAIMVVELNGAPDALYSTLLDGSIVPIMLNMSNLANGLISSTFSSSDDSRYVVFLAMQDTSNVLELYSAPADGSGAQVKLNPSLTTGRRVEQFKISPDNRRVAYIADQDTDDVIELYSVRIGGGAVVRINSDLPAGGDVLSSLFSFSPDGQWIAYVADQETDDLFELYVAPSDGSAAPVKVNGPLVSGGDVEWFLFSPDGASLAYIADQDVDNRIELYLVSLEGGAGAVRVNAPLSEDGDLNAFWFSPDGRYLLYLADQEVDGRQELYSVALPDGAPRKLNQELMPGEEIYGIGFSPDSSFLLYYLYSEASEQNVLFSVPPDGSRPPLLVNDELIAGGSIGHYIIGPDSDRVVYTAEQETPGVYELYSALPDGSGDAVKLNSPLVEGGSVRNFELSPSGSHVIYRADEDVDEVEELYAAPLPEPIVPTATATVQPTPSATATTIGVPGGSLFLPLLSR